MRRTHVIGIAVVSLLTVGSVAQAQSATPGVQETGRRGVARYETGRGRLLRGIKLSEAEKARVKEIRGKYQTESKALRESLGPAMQEVRAARQKHDTVAMKAAWDRTAADRQKLDALMQRERAEIRTALTPEHQTQFDANVKQRGERRAEGRKGKGHRPRKADRLGTSKN